MFRPIFLFYFGRLGQNKIEISAATVERPNVRKIRKQSVVAFSKCENKQSPDLSGQDYLTAQFAIVKEAKG